MIEYADTNFVFGGDMADGLLTSGLNWTDQQKRILYARLGLLMNNPQEFARQLGSEARQRAGVGLFGEPKTAQEMASGAWINSPYGQQAMQAASGFVGSIKPVKPAQAEGLLEYRGSHTAPNAKSYGATIDNLGGIMPADVYSSKGTRLYGIGNPEIDSQWFSAAYKAKGKPDAEITVYRAVPKGVKNINSGDWVTTSKRYAQDHGESALNGEYEIVTRKVKAKTLSSEGYPYEFGYNE